MHSWSSVQNINKWGLWIKKRNSLFNLISQQPDIDRIYLYTKDLYEGKYHFLINKRESKGLKHFNDMDDIWENNEEHNPNKKRKVLIVFDDMIADMLNNKKFNPIVTELFIRGRN